MSASAELKRPDRSLPLAFAPRRGRVAELLIAEGIHLALLYGSQAQGRQHEGSDVDIGLLAADGKPLSYARMGRLAGELSGILAADVDVSDLATPDAIFRYEVVRCARVLFEASPGAFRDFVARTLIDYSDIERFVPELVAGVARRARRQTGPAGSGAGSKT